MSQKACSNCAHGSAIPGDKSGAVQCREKPPQVLVLSVPHPITQQLMQQVTFLWPSVAGDAWCGRWRVSEPVLSVVR